MNFNQKHKDSQSNKTFFLTFLCPGKLLIKKGWGRGKGGGGEEEEEEEEIGNNGAKSQNKVTFKKI
jgi:hypothetical protein